MSYDPNASYFGTESMDVSSTEFASHTDNFENDGSNPTTRYSVLNNTSLYGPSGSRKPIIVFFSRKAITELANVDPSGFTPRTDVVGITITFGMDNGTFILMARCSDQEGLCPSGLEDHNFKNAGTAITNAELTSFSNSFKSSGYGYLQDFDYDDHPEITFNNVALYDLLYDLTSQQKSGIGGTSAFHVVISNNFSTLCLDLNGVRGTAAYKEGLPCPPKCY